MLRLDEDDAAAAWRDRAGQLHEAGAQARPRTARRDPVRRPRHRSDRRSPPHLALRRRRPGMTTVDGVNHNPNLPTEEVFTTPDPQRADGIVTATKPLDLNGALVEGLTIRFEGGRAVQIDADSGVDAMRSRCAKDEGASRARRARARRPRGPDRQDRHRLLQHAPRRERGQPPCLRERLRDRRRRGRPRSHQQERDSRRLHGRQRRRLGDRADEGRARGAGSPRGRLAAVLELLGHRRRRRLGVVLRAALDERRLASLGERDARSCRSRAGRRSPGRSRAPRARDRARSTAVEMCVSASSRTPASRAISAACAAVECSVSAARSRSSSLNVASCTSTSAPSATTRTRLDGRRVARDARPAAGPRRAEHGVGRQHAAVGRASPTRRAAARRAPARSGPRARRPRRRRSAPAAVVLVERVPDAPSTPWWTRKDEDPVAVAVERLARPRSSTSSSG